MIHQQYSFCNTPKTIQSLVSSSTFYQKILAESETKVRFSMTHFVDQPDWVSGWAHNFVCPDCASQMTFDYDRPYKEGKEFTCPVCGKKASGKKLEEAWVYYYRYNFSFMMTDIALQICLGNEEAFSFFIHYMDFYAKNYQNFPLHGEHAGKGKITEQCLDEAVFAINLLRALKVAGEKIDDELKNRWYTGLFHPIIETLRPQINQIHNIHCWMKCAIGMIGMYFDHPELLEEALEGPYGIREQIKQGFTKDGIWFEGSMGYHFYTVEGLTYFFSFYAEKCPEDSLFDQFESMYTVPLTLSYDRQTLCALNDGWYPITMPTEQTNVAARILNSPVINNFLQKANRVESVWRLLLDLNVDDGITLLQDTRLAVFRKPLFAILKAGSLARNHMHFDVLSLRFPPYSDDIGTPGYGHPLTQKWYRTAQCHNTVVIDGKQPEDPISSTIEKIHDEVIATAETWHGVDWKRTLSQVDEKLSDTFTLESNESHTYTWFFHTEGELLTPVSSTPASLTEGIFELFKDVRALQISGDFSLSFLEKDGKTFTISVSQKEAQKVFLAQTPGNPANHLRTCLILQQDAKDAEFSVKYWLS